MKIGIVARVDASGLARMTYGFWKNIHEITKELVVLISDRDNDLYRYPKATICNVLPTIEAIDIFLKDLDLVLIFETPYNWNIIKMAKDRGIKTVMIPMYEWTNPKPPIHPDMYLCPSLLDYDSYKDSPAEIKYIQTPVDRKQFKFKLREKANTFVFNNGGGGSGGRNGLSALIEAIPLVKSDVKFIIRSLRPIPKIEDKRVDVRIGDFDNLFDEGDVFLFPHMFNGLSLPIQEALSSGMPVLSTNIYPHNTYLPKRWLFEPDGFKKGRVNENAREIDTAILDPQKIADKIDEYAGKDITEDSRSADAIAETISWDNLKENYIKTFTELCKKQL
jgi:glycosyltransferase involved in cell wall biosynthesis